MAKIYHENEEDVIHPGTLMHYALCSGYQRTRFPQTHDFFELLLPLSGRQELTVGGARLCVEPGVLTLIRPGEVHARRYLQPGQHINVAFSARVARQMFDYLGDGFPVARLLCAPAPLCAALTRAQAESYRTRFDQLNMIPVGDAARSRMMLRALLAEIFTREFVFDERGEDAPTAWFSRLVDAMKTPDALARGVEAMVALSGKTHEHLCRTCRRHMAMTPTEFVNDLRLTYAANRLLHSGDSIADICFAAGFESLSHFYHLFRRKYRKTPREFRESA